MSTTPTPAEGVEACARDLSQGRATSEGLVRRGLARIRDLDPDRLHAVIATNPDALGQAQAADHRREHGECRGPLDGVPFIVKDCIETVGMATTHGSPLFEGWRVNRDAEVIARLRAAGAVLLAKANLDDFAAATVGRSSVRGLMHNPYDRTRTVGGSSGGSAVSVAAGYAPLAIGTDTGGSLRIPAALCGVVALRPTQGLLPTTGMFPRSFDQDTAGPMTSTVRGAALALTAMSQGRVRPLLLGPNLAPKVAGLRVGVVRTGLALWGDDPDGPVLDLFDATLDALRSQGVTPVPIPAPPRRLLDESSLISAQSAVAVDGYLAHRPNAPVRTFVELVASGAYTEAAGVHLRAELDADPSLAERATNARGALIDWTADTWQRYGLDAVAYPTAQRVAAFVDHEQAGVYTRWSEHTGMPSLAVPMGNARSPITKTDLPASVELLARRYDEPVLVALGCAVEQVVAARTGQVRHASLRLAA